MYFLSTISGKSEFTAENSVTDQYIAKLTDYVQTVMHREETSILTYFHDTVISFELKYPTLNASEYILSSSPFELIIIIIIIIMIIIIIYSFKVFH